MADIVESSKMQADQLMTDFKKVVESTNEKHKKSILSPLTITLGDEFQGVITGTEAALQIIFNLEEELLKLTVPFKMRYVLVEGRIDTPLNKKNAHGMLGPGLTEARSILTSMKSGKNRFAVKLKDTRTSEKIMLALHVLQGISDQWTPPQKKIAHSFLQLGDYKKVASKLKKDASAIWRRKNSLLIDEYNDLRTLIFQLI
ncbi:MAG TPA: SatD family protein [Cyclobacteriaceae bacterium]|jgi:hypothetical protein|nr:SatD family protein [Cyclobacteriaceae bacterium]